MAKSRWRFPITDGFGFLYLIHRKRKKVFHLLSSLLMLYAKQQSFSPLVVHKYL